MQRTPQPHRFSIVLLLLALLLAGCIGSAGVSEPDGLLATVLTEPPPIRLTVTPGIATSIPSTATSTPTDPAAGLTATATVTPLPASTSTATPVDPTATMSPTPSGAGDATPVIVLDPGHDRMFPSALGIEYQVNLRTALIAREALEAAG
ncbi:MAG TPA: hypothetical protein VFV93_10960, partial [Thermomicrobiales bacterium]|nr:hypothetical protein [Thermomicrobiales bacterium]